MADRHNPFLIGRRVRLISCTDTFTKLKPGDEGTVTFVDGVGSVFVDWDSGSRLAMLPNIDKFEVIEGDRG